MEVNIKKIEPNRFASFYGFGKQPEEEAMNKLLRWCQKRNINIDDRENIIYGFNNPNPTPEISEYGYEFWFKVNIDERPEEDVRIIEYHGGNYAIAECIGAENMFQTWQALYKWCVDNKYRIGHHQALERIIENISDINKIRIELCCPVILN
ncbi:MAG: GyrI-like domain-containing protein [Ignavibacteriae bacterium]|nr:GyrI-like domain-containing protein [Ignavibacteriota bacterium]